MDNNIIRSWNGRTIRQRADGYLSATDMCQACGKRWSNWERLDSSREYLEALQNKRYSDVSNGKLMDTTQGGIPEKQGTWVYRKIAIRLAQWLSPDFAIQVDEWIEELLINAKVEIGEQVLQLPPEDIRIVNLVDALKSAGIDPLNPRLNQAIQDLVGNKILGVEPVLSTSEKWQGVAEIAYEIGYGSIARDISLRSQLGKFISRLADKHNLVRKQEKRLCNGTTREIWLYLDTPQLRKLVNGWCRNCG